MEKLIISQVIILSKSEITQKRNLRTAPLNIKHNQAMSKISNTRV